ncbi:MAG TPA: thioredoxin family protein [Ignavibacteriales bacterium]|nr:thioredoxin family protein [Ignavibacteriales bacterium]
MKLLILLSIISFVSLAAQEKLKTVTDENSGRPMLIGEAQRSAFRDTSYAKWFNPEYDSYRVKTKDLVNIADTLKNFNITIVMGTWCSDSHREVPRFYKILDTLRYPENKIKLIMVDRKRKDLSGSVDTLNIKAVPTIIFFKDGVEKGRIVEAPEETLEKDTYNIVTGSSKSEGENKEPPKE